MLFSEWVFPANLETNVFGGTILSKILPQDQLDCLKLYDSRMPRGIGHVWLHGIMIYYPYMLMGALQLGSCGYVVVDGYCHKLCPVEEMPPLARKAEQWISTHTITTPLHTSIYCYLVASCAMAWCIPWDWIWEVGWLAATMFGGNPRRCQNY